MEIIHACEVEYTRTRTRSHSNEVAAGERMGHVTSSNGGKTQIGNQYSRQEGEGPHPSPTPQCVLLRAGQTGHDVSTRDQRSMPSESNFRKWTSVLTEPAQELGVEGGLVARNILFPRVWLDSIEAGKCALISEKLKCGETRGPRRSEDATHGETSPLEK